MKTKILEKQFIYSIRIITALFSLTLAFSCDNPQVAFAQQDFNIVLITIDTLRADHLSCYGYERETSPNIDKVAEEGIIFKNTIAPSSWTVPSMASLFTSTYPINHGMVNDIESRREKKEVISDNLTTLAEALQKEGYSTFGVSSNYNLTTEFGFARGFDYFKYKGWIDADGVNSIVSKWEDTINKSEKYFLWVHYNDPHIPYVARSPWLERYASQFLTYALGFSGKIAKSFQFDPVFSNIKEHSNEHNALIALYDSEINYVDSFVGKLINKFGLDKDTLLIITSDHGEEFLEHGKLGHGKNLYQETTRVPLIVKVPQNPKKKTVEKYVNLIDIMPSILHAINVDSPSEQILGKSFLETQGVFLWLKKVVSRNDPSDYNLLELDRTKIIKSVLTPQWKYIYNYEDNSEQLYNIILDPLELNNLVDKEVKQRNRLKEQLFQWVSTAKKYPPKKQDFKLPPEEEEKLRAMGYLDEKENEDYDNDFIPNVEDNCSGAFNPNQEDSDGDAIGDVCDNCPNVANTDRRDTDKDGSGNICDSDDDNDGIEDLLDNCPFHSNPGQEDTFPAEGNGVGDACESRRIKGGGFQ